MFKTFLSVNPKAELVKLLIGIPFALAIAFLVKKDLSIADKVDKYFENN